MHKFFCFFLFFLIIVIIILDCAFEKKLLPSADCNLTDNLLFSTVIKGLTCISEICPDMLHSLGGSLSPFYLFRCRWWARWNSLWASLGTSLTAVVFAEESWSSFSFFFLFLVLQKSKCIFAASTLTTQNAGLVHKCTLAGLNDCSMLVWPDKRTCYW